MGKLKIKALLLHLVIFLSAVLIWTAVRIFGLFGRRNNRHEKLSD